MQDDGRVLDSVALLFDPDRRDAAFEGLERRGALGTEGRQQLGGALSAARYSARNMGPHLARAKILVDGLVAENRYCPLNPLRHMEHLRARKALSPEHFAPDRFVGSTIVDFGAGTFDTFGQAIIMVANGAKRVYCIEPGALHAESVHRGAVETVKAIFEMPTSFDVSGSSAAAMRERLASLDLQALANAAEAATDGQPTVQVGPITFANSIDDVSVNRGTDMLFSTSVLEHVSGLDHVIRSQAEMLKSNGVAIQLVDFTDHRFDEGEYHPFKFYYDGRFKDCNGLRVGDIEAMMEEAGLAVTRSRTRTLPSEELPREGISERFRSYDEEDLLTRTTTFTARPRGSSPA